MEGTPKEMDYDSIKEELTKIHGVKSLHDLHIWSLNMETVVLS
jgi:Co/Zn/Cd efflux system component